MGFIKPEPFLFDYEKWKKSPFAEKIRLLCIDWATEGFGTPFAAVFFYVLKLIFYVWGWTYVCSFSSELGTISNIGEWWYHPQAIGKLIAWTLLFEGTGLGSASGPLTLHFFPPFVGMFNWLRPGTLKVPFIPGMPIFGGDQRTIVTVLLYLANLVLLVYLCIAPEITPQLVLPSIIVLLLMGLSDRVVFMAHRPEIYLIGLACFMVPEDTISGLKTIVLAVWLWAAFSKITHLFSSVVCTMVSNSFFMTNRWLRKKMYADFPHDLRPSRFANVVAHMGTVVELGFPLLLLFGDGGPVTTVGLIIMVVFHCFIISTFPVAVPLEWNVFMMITGGALFWGGGMGVGLYPFDISNPFLLVALLTTTVILPLLGNLFPKHISFLFAKRYYAGNWAISIWLFRGEEAEEKLDTHLVKSAKNIKQQALMFYDEDTAQSMLDRLMVFRFMHVQGRVMHEMMPLAVDNMNNYIWHEGDMLAGHVVGWNFGDAHFSQEYLLRSVQKRCQYKSGELVCLFAESMPLLSQDISWRIVDAKDGDKAKGTTKVKDLLKRKSWPEGEYANC